MQSSTEPSGELHTAPRELLTAPETVAKLQRDRNIFCQECFNQTRVLSPSGWPSDGTAVKTTIGTAVKMAIGTAVKTAVGTALKMAVESESFIQLMESSVQLTDPRFKLC